MQKNLTQTPKQHKREQRRNRLYVDVGLYEKYVKEVAKDTVGLLPFACLIMHFLLFLKDALFCTLTTFPIIQEQKHHCKVLGEKKNRLDNKCCMIFLIKSIYLGKLQSD